MLVGGRQEAVPVEECRLLVARVEHMQRQVAMGVCDEAMRTFPSRTLHCPAIENAGTSTLPARQLSRARGTKKAKTHGRSVFRRQSKIHFRGTIAPHRQLTCAHRLPASATPVWGIAKGREQERQSVTQPRKDSGSTCTVSKHHPATRRARHPLQTPLTQTWIWASRIASNRAPLQPYRSMFVPPRGLGPIACIWVAFWRDHRG